MGINLEDYYNEDNIKLSDERIKELVSWYIKEHPVESDILKNKTFKPFYFDTSNFEQTCLFDESECKQLTIKLESRYSSIKKLADLNNESSFTQKLWSEFDNSPEVIEVEPDPTSFEIIKFKSISADAA
jgi:hypothetical protein